VRLPLCHLSSLRPSQVNVLSGRPRPFLKPREANSSTCCRGRCEIRRRRRMRDPTAPQRSAHQAAQRSRREEASVVVERVGGRGADGGRKTREWRRHRWWWKLRWGKAAGSPRMCVGGAAHAFCSNQCRSRRRRYSAGFFCILQMQHGLNKLLKTVSLLYCSKLNSTHWQVGLRHQHTPSSTQHKHTLLGQIETSTTQVA
jgi:hypothetical protein